MSLMTVFSEMAVAYLLRLHDHLMHTAAIIVGLRIGRGPDRGWHSRQQREGFHGVWAKDRYKTVCTRADRSEYLLILLGAITAPSILILTILPL